MRTKNNPYKLHRGNKQQIGRVSPKKSPKKTSMQNLIKADKTRRDSGSPQTASTPDIPQLYACYQCDNIYVGSEPLIRHQKEAHKDGPIFLLPQKVIEVMGTKDVKQIVDAFGDRLNILDNGKGCHGRVMLSVDVNDINEWVDDSASDVDVTLDQDSVTKVDETSSDNVHQKNASKTRLDKRDQSASATDTKLAKAVEVLKKSGVKRGRKHKKEDGKSSPKVSHAEEGKVLSPHDKARDADASSRTKVKPKTGAVKPFRKQHILKVKLRLNKTSRKKKTGSRTKLDLGKSSRNLKKYVCWGCGVSYDQQSDLAQHKASCRMRSLSGLEVIQGTTREVQHKKTVIGTLTEMQAPAAPLSALTRRRQLPGLSCLYCGEWYMNCVQLDRHKKLCMNKGTDERRFKCSGCSQVFSLRYDQCMHLLNHCPSVLDDITGPNAFVLSKLRNIQEQTERERVQSSAVEAMESGLVPSTNTLFCYDCARHVDVKNFRDHKLECCAKPHAMLTCLDCCERFATRLEMNEHKRRKHLYHFQATSCTCGEAFKKNSDFLQHLKDNPSHCLSPIVGPKLANTPNSPSSAYQDTLDIAEGMESKPNTDTSVDCSAAQADVASFMTSVPSEKGKVCHVQVHTSAEGNAITNVTVQFQGQSLDINVPGTDVCAPATTKHAPASVPASRDVAEGRRKSKKEETEMPPASPHRTALPTARSSDTNPLAALGLVRRISFPATTSKGQPTQTTADTTALQPGLDAVTRSQPVTADKPGTSTPCQLKPKQNSVVNRVHQIKKVMLPGMKIGYLVPVSKTMNEQAAMAEAKKLLQTMNPRMQQKSTNGSECAITPSSTKENGATATSVSQETKQASLVDTPATLKSASQLATTQKQTPQIPTSHTAAVQAPGTHASGAHGETSRKSATRTRSAQGSPLQTPERQKPAPQTPSQSATLASAPRKKTPQTSAGKSESPALHAKKVDPHKTAPPQPAANRTSVEPVSAQQKPVPETVVLRHPSGAATTPTSNMSKAADVVAGACKKATGSNKREGKSTDLVVHSANCDSLAADGHDVAGKTRQAPKRKRNENAERDNLDDSSSAPGPKRSRPSVSTSRCGGTDKRLNVDTVDKAATAVNTKSGSRNREENGVTVTNATRAAKAGVARDVATGKRAAASRSLPTRVTKSAVIVADDVARTTRSASSLPSPTKEVATSAKSQPTARSKTKPHTPIPSPRRIPTAEDAASTSGACVRHVENAGSRSSAQQPQRPTGLMLIAPVNTDTVRCIRCEAKFTRVRDITAHECDGRPVSVIVQAELKLGARSGYGGFASRGSISENGGGIKLEPHEGQ